MMLTAHRSRDVLKGSTGFHFDQWDFMDGYNRPIKSPEIATHFIPRCA